MKTVNVYTQYGILYLADTAHMLRDASAEEIQASEAAAEHDQGRGIFAIDAMEVTTQEEIDAFDYAYRYQGFDEVGGLAEWLSLPAEERKEYELGAQGIPTA
jgi:hypothetical protein